MNSNTKQVIEASVHESNAGLLSFPKLIERLVAIGVESYFADYRDQSITFYLLSNETICVGLNLPTTEIPSTFDKNRVIEAIRAAQSDKVKYPEFLKLTMVSGCIGYIVWITGKYVSYFGRKGEVHIEDFPKE